MGDKYDEEAARVVADVVRAVVLSTSDRGASISIEASPMSAALVAIILRRVAADATRAERERCVTACKGVKDRNKQWGHTKPGQDFYARSDGAAECITAIHALATTTEAHEVKR